MVTETDIPPLATTASPILGPDGEPMETASLATAAAIAAAAADVIGAGAEPAITEGTVAAPIVEATVTAAEAVVTGTAPIPVRDAVHVEKDAAGSPRGAQIEREPAFVSRSRHVSRAESERPDLSSAVPAERRVLASGNVVPGRIEATSGSTERFFTASTRILKSKTLYEPGSPVPLTLNEFIDKRDARAVVEELWSEGADEL